MTLAIDRLKNTLGRISYSPDFHQVASGDDKAAGAVIAFGPNGDFDPGYVLDDIAIFNRNAKDDGDEHLQVITSLSALADSAERGAGLKVPEAGSRELGARDAFLVWVNGDSAADVVWDMDSQLLLRHPNSGKANGHPGEQDAVTGVGPVWMRIPRVADGNATVERTIRYAMKLDDKVDSGLVGYVYSRVRRTSALGTYVLNVYRVRAGVPTLVLSSADFNLAGVTNKEAEPLALTSTTADKSFEPDDILRVTATSSNADLTVGGDVLVELPRVLL